MLKNKIPLGIVLFLITFFFISCSNYNNGYKTNTEKAKYITTAEEKYTDNINYIFSPDSAFVVSYKTEAQTTDSRAAQLRFFIYDLNNEKIIFEDKSRTDKIEWINNTQVQVLKRPGIISVDPKKNSKMFGYIYDISLNKKLPLSEPENYQLQ